MSFEHYYSPCLDSGFNGYEESVAVRVLFTEQSVEFSLVRCENRVVRDKVQESWSSGNAVKCIGT